ncbi:MAG: 1-phosphofructokinase family hexose kinase, partial [Octadecabacter sp.]|nr:1-phosphofructokinase family hexose kinase [Octadecabacter sp.]
MTRVLTVTVNPAIDLATTVDQVIAGPKLRCGPALTDPGGGGVNVARTIAKLGGQATALFTVGGTTGDLLTSLVKAEGVDVLPVPVKGETRQNFAVTDASSAEQYRFSLMSHPVDVEDEAILMAAIVSATPADSIVVLSGGLAPAMSENFHTLVQNALDGRGARVIVDTCDPALAHLLAHPPKKPFHVLRIDQHESEIAAGHPLSTMADSLEFTSDLMNRGVADCLIIGRGAEGSVMASRKGNFFCHAPQVSVRSKIGAGDSFVGAFTLSLSRGEAPE